MAADEPEPVTVAQALARARRVGVERLDAQLLLAKLLGRPRAWLLAHADAPLAAADALAHAGLLVRRAAGEPLAYLVGEREFHGLALHVTPDVLVPRPDTETLVDWALELLSGPLGGIDAPTVVDLGTGSGAIALAIKHACPRAQVHATDASPAALAVASGNGQRLQLPVRWHLGDWWHAVPLALLPQVHLAVANPPYIAPGDPHLANLDHEPVMALVAQGDAGDGMADIERIVAGAPERLQGGGWLLIEHGFEQSETVCERMRRCGLSSVSTRADLAGRPRVSGGRRGGARP
jgi:release factor glutamine methyltransferase